MHRRTFAGALGALACLAAGAASAADPAPFDLAGPAFEVTVTRGAQTLPVSAVPNLAAGDRLWVKPDFPPTQSARYLLVLAFLRGATNPPPSSWFVRCETWARPCADEGMEVAVPQGAQQVLVLLAPATGGDFRTLVSAVRERPGAFVRASQDLNQATLDRARLEAYLAAIRTLDQTDPARLKQAAPLLARSLAIKVEEKCLDRIPELQAPCLMQGQDALILNDGHSTSIVEALTSGPASDLAMEASYTPQLRYGYYSPYIASVLDIARIMDSFRTAQYQYIPALASQQGDELSLALNTPPSFRDPKSVLVTALPAVEPAQLPPLHAVDPDGIYCARRDSLVLPVEGAPLVFASRYAFDLKLSLSSNNGQTIELPARPDAEQGGLAVDTAALEGAALGDDIRGSLHGNWGFERYEGPAFRLVNVHAPAWRLASIDEGTLIAGRPGTVHLQAASVSCIDGIMLRDPAGKEIRTDWKTVKPDEVEVTLPLQATVPGPLTLLVSQYGVKQPAAVALQTFSEAGHLDGFMLHAGDAQGVLRGSRLDEVAALTLKGYTFSPGTLTAGQGEDTLAMAAGSAADADALTQGAFTPGETVKARAILKDGRALPLPVTISVPRPSAQLIAKSVEPSASSGQSNIELQNADELPQDARLTFSLRSKYPQTFRHDEQVEVATADEAFLARLGLANGGLTLEDASVAVAVLDPAQAFGPSAFGPLKFRVVDQDGAGDWQPLATLVRLPVLKEIQCPAGEELACRLSGSNLFLVDSIATDAQFSHPVPVPDGFPGQALPVPRPSGGQLYVKLRDDPGVVHAVTLGAEQRPATPAEAARAEVRHAAAQETTETPRAVAPSPSTTDSSQPPQPPSSGASATAPSPTPPATAPAPAGAASSPASGG